MMKKEDTYYDGESLKIPIIEPLYKEDNINHPTHYTNGEIEVIDYMQDKLTEEGFEGYCIGNVIKYISRYRNKNGLEDLRKAEWYLNRIIKVVDAGVIK